MRHLREQRFAHAPELFGTALVNDTEGETWVAATSQRFIAHPTDLEASLREILRTETADERMITTAEHVADALAALHRALGTPGADPSFATEPIQPADLRGWRASAHEDLDALVNAGVHGVVAVRDPVADALDVLPDRVDASSGRAHGRLTLRRVLLVEGVPVFVGFGETTADKSSPLKDVASLARSFDTVTRETIVASAHDPTADHGERSVAMREITARALAAFMARYAASASDLATSPADPSQRDALLRFFRVRTALRDVRDALSRRPGALGAAVDALQAEVR
jgi:predicted trehalose synthase